MAVEEIRAAMGEHPKNLKEYPAGWDFEADTVTGLEALNGMVYRDLKQSLADLMPEDEEKSLIEWYNAVKTLQSQRLNRAGDAPAAGVAAAWREYEEGEKDLFFGLLARAARHTKVVLVISGLQLLSDADSTVSWMARFPRKNVVVVFSARGNALEPYMEPARHYLPTLLDKAGECTGYRRAETMLSQFAAEYGKRLHTDVLHRASLAVSTRGGTPLYARVLADYLMNMIGADYLACTGPDAHLRSMRAALDVLPGTTGGLYRLVIERARAEFGSLVHSALGLMAASRIPIPDTLFAEALSAAEGREVENLELYSLRGYFNIHLARTRQEIYWGFAHSQMLDAARADYTDDDLRRLAGCLYRSLDDAPSSSVFALHEWLYYAWMADIPEGLYGFMEKYVDDSAGRQAAAAAFFSWIQEIPSACAWLVRAYKAFPRGCEARMEALAYLETARPKEPEALEAFLPTREELLGPAREWAAETEDPSLQRRQGAALCRFEYRLLMDFQGARRPGGRQTGKRLARLAGRWESLLDEDDTGGLADLAELRLYLRGNSTDAQKSNGPEVLNTAAGAVLSYLSELPGPVWWAVVLRDSPVLRSAVAGLHGNVGLPERDGAGPRRISGYTETATALTDSAIEILLDASADASVKGPALLAWYRTRFGLYRGRPEEAGAAAKALQQAIHWGRKALPLCLALAGKAGPQAPAAQMAGPIPRYTKPYARPCAHAPAPTPLRSVALPKKSTAGCTGISRPPWRRRKTSLRRQRRFCSSLLAHKATTPNISKIKKQVVLLCSAILPARPNPFLSPAPSATCTPSATPCATTCCQG